MKTYLIALIVPAFLLCVWLEYYISKKNKEKIFEYSSSISNVSIGIAERFINLFVAGLFYGVFVWVYHNYALFTIPNIWYTGILLLLVADFVWYWYHRLGHQINIFWAAHIVHHHSSEFNFTAATRITTIQALIRTPFWCFLPLLGFHPNQVLVVLVIHGGYSFFTHTQIIKAPKWLEKIIITPSLHGVHHASNERYLDKNFGDVFVFWDKLFGTFIQEDEKPVYGITHPLNRSSFLWQHFHYYLEIFEAVKRQPTFIGKLKMIFGNPAVLDQNIRPYLEQIFFKNEKQNKLSINLKRYVNIQLILSLVLLCFVTINYEKLSIFEKFDYTGILLFTLINIGALLEQKKWIYYLEIIRLSFVLTLFINFFANPEIILVLFTIIFVLFLDSDYKKWYFERFLGYENNSIQ